MEGSERIAYMPTAVGGGDGVGGFGGGIGGLLVGALLGRGLLGDGRRDGSECVTPAQLIAGLNNVTDNASTTAILEKLGSIEAAIPFNEAQVQLALATAQNAIQGQAVTNATAAASASTSQLVSTLTSRSDILSAINADGDRTRALIVASDTAALNRELGVAQTALLEERFGRRSRESEINISNTNTAVAAQSQAQAQAQQQTNLIAVLAARLDNLSGDIQAVRQTQSNVNFGVQAGTAQTAGASNNKV